MFEEEAEKLLQGLSDRERLVLLSIALQTSAGPHAAARHDDVMTLSGLAKEDYSRALASLEEKRLVHPPRKTVLRGDIQCELSPIVVRHLNDPTC